MDYTTSTDAFAPDDEAKALLAQISEQGFDMSPSERILVRKAQSQNHGFTAHQLSRLKGIVSRKNNVSKMHKRKLYSKETEA